MNNMKLFAQKYGTPLYLFYADEMEKKYQMMKSSLPNQFEIFFSVKANSALAICQILQKNGSGIEVASKGELCLALNAGFSPSKILFSGPGKVYSELEYAIDNNIAAIVAESFHELKLIDEIARLKGKKVNVGIRINPNYESVQKNPVISMMGVGTQFGVDKNELPNIVNFLRETNNLNLTCFHIYAGSQIYDYKIAATYFNEATNMLSQIIKEYNLNIDIIDFGGGFGVPYNKNEMFDFNCFSEEVNKIYNNNLSFFEDKRLVFESGRFLTARCGYFLTEVQYRKEINGRTFLITDGGMNQMAIATYREKKLRSNFIMNILDNDNSEEIVSVAGPLCTPDDILGRNVTLNKANRGDILCIPNAGAYGSSFSPLKFLGHPNPCEVLVYKDSDQVIKERGKAEDILKDQVGLIMHI
ncbi:diaminopimelate decarboxylase [Clostridium sporogenes]|uniref:diaminopimelate decarboxylase n=1 Tax=Clostridium sporogenes TaxID=1509 RepID=UPI0022381EA6|nr:diaminopimelate decarboxylase [Clostridium sporogenes]MCW6109101.1 diaminopimelate decarboxylase [Clostridium sporogenes]